MALNGLSHLQAGVRNNRGSAAKFDICIHRIKVFVARLCRLVEDVQNLV